MRGRKEIEWRQKTHRFSVGSFALLGDVVIGETDMPSQTKSYVGPRWGAVIRLPGIKFKQDCLFETEHDAREAMRRAVDRWFYRVMVEGDATDELPIDAAQITR